MSNIWAALAKAQQNFGPVGTSGRNPHFRSTYATLGDIHKATRRALLDAGLVVTSAPGQTEDGMFVECTIAHAESGETVSQRCPLLVGKQDMQGLGSAISYARRYLLLSMLDLDMDGLDDDGEATKTQPQRAQPESPQDATDAPHGDSRANGTIDTPEPPQGAVEAPDNPFAAQEKFADKPAADVIASWSNPADAQKWAIDIGANENKHDAREAFKRAIKAVTGNTTVKASELPTVYEWFWNDRIEKLQLNGAAKVAA